MYHIYTYISKSTIMNLIEKPRIAYFRLSPRYRLRGFDEVLTPNICSAELFKRSGHYQNYRHPAFF